MISTLFSRKILLHISLFLIAVSLTLTTNIARAQTAEGEVTVRKGPTPIPNGNARHEKDITLENGLIAVSFAVESRPPWGVAPGGILDLAVIRMDSYSTDLASLVDFMPNNWSSWPTSYQNVEVIEDGPERGVIRVERDWHGVVLTTTFTLERGEQIVHMQTEMVNKDDEVFEDILSGYVTWADGGYFFNRPGVQEEGPVSDTLRDWTASYEKDWALAFHAPFAGYVAYGGQDQYRRHTLEPGDRATFEGWLQVIGDGELEPALQFQAQRNGLKTGTVSGSVSTAAGETVAEAIVVAEQNEEIVGWTIAQNGTYAFTLPVGDYSFYAVAEKHKASSSFRTKIESGKEISHDFTDLKKPGTIDFTIADSATGAPLDATITIQEGPQSPIAYFGRSMLFTNLNRPGRLSVDMAPGTYKLKIGHGAGFVSKAVTRTLEVKSGALKKVDIEMPIRYRPDQNHWYAADLHHHSNILDGSTPVPAVLQAQLSAGLDFAFLSDHDSAANNARMDSLASTRNTPFIPSMEISPSWGHFNAFPLDPGASLTINPSKAPSGSIIDEARQMGADAVAVNHPYIPYGYFTSLEKGTATGGFAPSFNLLELNPADDFAKVFDRLYSFWNQGLRIYLTAGSDTHDVWTGGTGRIRMMACIRAEPTPTAYANALKNGRAYATTGPLIEPSTMFGTQVRIKPGESKQLSFRLMAVNGLNSIRLIGNGETVDERNLEDAGDEAEVTFTVSPNDKAWYSIIVEDQEGKKAYSNPIWVKPVSFDAD